MDTAILIPARYGSSRLPGKPLLCETGKYLIQHVYERAIQARCARDVIVATDDSRVVAAVTSFGGHAVLTRSDHPSGTDRIAEVAATLPHSIIINLQGDEPTIDPDVIDRLAELVQADPDTEMATMAVPIGDETSYTNPNVVKVVCNEKGQALYFSRAPIPAVRDGTPDFGMRPPRFLQHLGIYAFRRHFLLRLARMPPHPLEQLEKLEQLRALAMGARIRVGIAAQAHRGIDTPADYAEFVHSYRLEQQRHAA